MTAEPTLFWYDFETSGIDSQRDRIFQVAGLRTNLDFEPVDEPVNLFCRPSNDFLPHPQACLVTGITPQIAHDKGLPEAEFCQQLLQQMMRPGTCALGYNSISFDDEFTRNLFYRNLHDPYAREWQNGNSRWDIIDLVRCTYALRPAGIEWPVHENGRPSFRLEDLTRVNNISHEHAHDALSDVYATIAMAKLIRQKQPKLYDYVFSHRGKNAAFKALSIVNPSPVLMVSSYIPASRGCISVVLPVAMHPQNKNSVLVYDLQQDPQEFMSLDSEQLKHLLYTPVKELKQGQNRLPVRQVQANKCPVLVPLNTLDEQAQQRFSIDVQQCLNNASTLQSAQAFIDRLPALFLPATAQDKDSSGGGDPDLAIYSGSFFSNEDRTRMTKLHHMSPEQLSQSMLFDDDRIPELLFRFRARNYPELLSENEKARWQEFRTGRLSGSDASGALSLEKFNQELTRLRQQQDLTTSDSNILNQLEDWSGQITADLEILRPA